MLRPKLWLFSSLAIAAGCGRHEPKTTAELLRRLPADNATVMRIDVDALRKAGLLQVFARGKREVEPEYQAFLNGTGFAYERDLDQALASFSPAGTFLLLKGRFDWPKLQAYAAKNGGSCYDKLCRMPGSVPERRISFLPLSGNLMALAVSTDDLAASRMSKAGPVRAFAIPEQPLWLTVPGSVLRKSSALPPATRIFTAALGASDSVTVTLGPAADGYEAKLDAQCKSAEDARVMTVQLANLTKMLKGFVGKGKTEDLGSVVAAGAFSQSGSKVYGVWTVRKQLLESLAGGG